MLAYDAMEIELKEIHEFPAQLKLFERSQDLQFEIEGVRFVNGVTIELSIQKTDHEYFVNGRCLAEVQMICARCLESATLKLSGDLSVIAQIDEPRRPRRQARAGKSGKRERSEQFEDSEELVQLDQSERLVLVEPVRQALFAEVPLKPLCREDCQGLCQKCGVNLNSKTCDCHKGISDSRWEGLGDQLEKNGRA